MLPAMSSPRASGRVPIEERLRSEPTVWLSSIRPDGRPHVVPVWFTWDGSIFDLYSKPNAQKVRNVRAHPEVVGYLRNECNEYLRALEYRFEREIRLHEAPDQAEDSVLRYLRADGREVRPGGRRKR